MVKQEEKQFTTITVSHECWKKINNLKNVGDSMEDVIVRALDLIQKEIKKK